jgi:hypothetical protein
MSGYRGSYFSSNADRPTWLGVMSFNDHHHDHHHPLVAVSNPLIQKVVKTTRSFCPVRKYVLYFSTASSILLSNDSFQSSQFLCKPVAFLAHLDELVCLMGSSYVYRVLTHLIRFTQWITGWRITHHSDDITNIQSTGNVKSCFTLPICHI